jgi:hypothetical protein
MQNPAVLASLTPISFVEPLLYYHHENCLQRIKGVFASILRKAKHQQRQMFELKDRVAAFAVMQGSEWSKKILSTFEDNF